MNDSNYKRLTLDDRLVIEQSLDKRKSARWIAEQLGRSNSTISYEIKHNKVFFRGSNKGCRADIDLSQFEKGNICPKLLTFPYVCNGCKQRGNHCNRPIRIKYIASDAHALASEVLSEARQGFNISEEEFKNIVRTVKRDLSKGLSPYAISVTHPEIKISPETLYRWIHEGFCGFSLLDLPKQAKYKQRRTHKTIPTKHGVSRSYEALCRLGEDVLGSVCQMDTVIGKISDTQCLLTLYLTNCKFQIVILLDSKTCSQVTRALDKLETKCGLTNFRKMFGTILTDNGTEFLDYPSLERSTTKATDTRTKIYYCDVRASNQKGGCEKNHVEIRKLLPKRCGISFDKLDTDDIAYINSQINSYPRKSLNDLSPIALFKTIYKDSAETLLSALEIKEITGTKLSLNFSGLNNYRKFRGLTSLNS